MTDEEQQAENAQQNEDPNAEGESQEKTLSRRERRAQAKGGGSEETVKDRNQRLRMEAAGRRREARESERDAAAAEGLATGERVDDALVRSADVTGKFVRDNFVWLQWIVIAGFAGAMGYLVIDYRKGVEAEKEGTKVGAALGTQFARLSSAEAETPADSRLVDPRPEFESQHARAEEALEKWSRIAKSDNKELQLVAQLGKANALYDQEKYKEARAQFEKTASDPGSKLFPELRARGLEGVGLSFEAEGVYPEATKAFENLKSHGGGLNADLAEFHLGRLLFLQKDKAKALALLEALDERLSKDIGSEGPTNYLGLAVRDLLMTVDPVRAIKEQEKRQAEQMQQMLKQFQEMQKQKGGAPSGLPGLPGLPEAPPAPAPPVDPQPADEAAPEPTKPAVAPAPAAPKPPKAAAPTAAPPAPSPVAPAPAAPAPAAPAAPTPAAPAPVTP